LGLFISFGIVDVLSFLLIDEKTLADVILAGNERVDDIQYLLDRISFTILTNGCFGDSSNWRTAGFGQ
jgi:hypothetical protein